MEELVARASPPSSRRDGAQDAAALAGAELLEHGRDLRLRAARPLGEVDGGVRDLRPAAADEEAEAVGRDVLLARAQLGEGVEQVALDDPPRAAERLEPCERQHRARRPRRCRARAARARAAGKAPRRGRRSKPSRRPRGVSPAAGRASSTAPIERRLDVERLGAGLERRVPGCDRPLDRLARCVARRGGRRGCSWRTAAGCAPRSGRASPTRLRGSRAARSRRGSGRSRSAQARRRNRSGSRRRPRPGGTGSTPRTGRGRRAAFRSARSTRAATRRATRCGAASASSPASSSSAARLASCTARIGSSSHERNDADANGLSPVAARASSRRPWTTPACSSELLPTPLGPYRIVSRAERRFAATIADLVRASEEERRVVLAVRHEPDVRALRAREALRVAVAAHPTRCAAAGSESFASSSRTYSLSSQ